MVRLRDIPRTATFAWSPGAGKPLIATGTLAGAVDADFSDESKLELWDLNLDDQGQGIELQPLASIITEARFSDIAWGPPNANYPRGIIAGGLENGTLALWDAAKLATRSPGALISQTTKHTGPIKALQFNPLKPQILATAGAKGELYVYDINDISNPFRLGNAAARADDIESLAWNRKVSHILATGGAGGFVTVWDLKTKKASLTLNNNRRAVSALAWDPNNSTRILTATSDDSTPIITLWNLRNSSAPEKTLQGHERGVLSLSWCTQDSSLLLSSGQDNKTIVWNPETAEKYGELPEVTNWTVQTSFNPHNPNLSATASLDGKITVQTLQNTNPDTSQAAANNNLDDEDFFKNVQDQPQGASWSLAKAPAWHKRPVGVSFGFGGKVVSFRPTAGKDRSSEILISQFSADSEVSSATEKFQQAIAAGDVQSICTERMEQAKTEEERADWQVMQTLVAENPRSKIIEYLGFQQTDMTNGEDATAAPAAETADAEKARIDKMFGDDDGADDDDFLADVTPTKEARTVRPFQLFTDSDTAVEHEITKALMLGNFAKATDICLKENRIADAFLIANCGGQELMDKVQTAYLAQKDGVPSYMRLLGSVIEKNLWDIVHNADLKNWKESMAILCTFSDPTEFPDLCDALGDRIYEQGLRKDASFCYLVGSKLEKVVKIWTAELEEAEKAGMNTQSDDSTFSVHARTLQSFIEKVTIFRHVTKFEDNEKGLTSGWKLAALYDKYTEYADILAGHGQLEVAQKYLDLLPTEYPAAAIARSRVQQANKKTSAAAAKHINRQAAGSRPQVGYQSQFGATPAPTFGAPAPMAQQPPQNSFGQPQNMYQPPNAYQPQQPAWGANPGAYQPAGYSVPAPPPIGAPPMGGPPRSSTPSAPPKKKPGETDNWNDVPIVTKAPRRGTPRAQPIASPFSDQGSMAPPQGPPQGPPPGPPMAGNPTPPPPPKGPALARVQSPLAPPPTGAPINPPPRPSSTANQYAPPPPLPGAVGSGLPGVVPMRTASPYNAPPSGAAQPNRYTPAPAAPAQSMPPPPGPGGMAPPPAAAPSGPAGVVNPYSQLAQQAPPPPQQQYGAPPTNFGAPPPSNFGAPPTNNFGAPPPNNFAPPPSNFGAPPQGPPQGPPRATPPVGPPPQGPPRAGPPKSVSTPTPPPPKAAAAAPPPAAARHPAGDRSHIPANAQELVTIFEQDMQRVAAKAPADFAPKVKDAQKRLSLLFDHLNNGELVQPGTIDELAKLAQAIQSKDYATASAIQLSIEKEKTDECGKWMVGVKRLINMSKATP